MNDKFTLDISCLLDIILISLVQQSYDSHVILKIN